jgi:fructokinase
VISQGRDGATAFRPGSVVSVPAVPIEVIDTVGGGDAFTAGLLHSLHELRLLDRQTLKEMPESAVRQCLERANRVAAITCTRRGAEPPTLSELESFQAG